MAVPDFSLNVHENRPHIVRVGGDLDAATVDYLISECERLPVGDLVIECSGLRFIDATALGAFVELNRVFHARGNRLIIQNPTPMARRLLEVTGLDRHVTVDPA